MIIDEFRGEYDFLSNFYSCPVTYNGESYLNSEDTGSRDSPCHVYYVSRTGEEIREVT